MNRQPIFSEADVQLLQSQLCSTFCTEVKLEKVNGHIAVPLPLSARDGDAISVYLDRAPGGGWRISDMGITFMRLSYEHELSKFLVGNRQRLLETVVSESGAEIDDGEIFKEVSPDGLIMGIFAVGQASSRVGDLSQWTRSRAESTFFEDLRELVFGSVDASKVTEGFIVPGIPHAESYPIDYRIETDNRQLFILGVNSRDRARLATITLQYLRSFEVPFESMIALSSLRDVPSTDLSRLMHAANDFLPNIEDPFSFKEKILHRVKSR